MPELAWQDRVGNHHTPPNPPADAGRPVCDICDQPLPAGYARHTPACRDTHEQQLRDAARRASAQ